MTPGAAEELLEPKHIELVGLGVEHVSGGSALDPIGPERRPEMRDVALDRVARRVRRVLVPHAFDQFLHRHDPVRGEEEVSEDQPLPRSAQGHLTSTVGHLQGTQQPELEVSRDRVRADWLFPGGGRTQDGEQIDRLRDPLQSDGAARVETGVVHRSREVHELGRDQDLARSCASAESCGEVQRAASVPVAEGHRLACVDPDPDAERHVGRLVARQRGLEVERRPDRFSGGVEDREDLITANLDDRSLARLDPLARDRHESLRQRGSRLVASGVAEACVSAKIRDQERADHGRGLARSGRSS